MSREKTKLPRNVRLLQVHAFFLNMIFILPVIVPYYRDVIGLGFREFMIGEAAFSAVMILMEVPTGWLADIWTRKHTMALGMAVNVLGYVWLWQADCFADTVIAQSILGVSLSLLSGTTSALLYDSLLEAGMESEYRKQEGFRQGLGLYVIAGASVLGGVLYQFNHQLPIILTAATSLGALAANLMMVEPGRHKEQGHKNPFVDVYQTMRYALHGHVEIAGIIMLSAVLFAATKTLLWTQQPYYIVLGLAPAWFGVLSATGFVLGGLGGHFGHALDGRFRNISVLTGFLGAIIAVCLIAGLWPGHHAIPLLLTGSMMFGIGWPRVQAAINKRVSSARRATILSTASLMIHVVAIPLMVVIGAVEKSGGITTALLFLAGALSVGGIAGLLLIKRMNGRAGEAGR